MIRPSQSIRQTQSLQQRLSPQQIQYIKLLQLPTLMLEQRVKQELETNPVLEMEDEFDEQTGEEQTDHSEQAEGADTSEEESSGDTGDEDVAAVDENDEIDWDSFFADDDQEYVPAYNREQEDWRDLPKPYRTSFTEQLERQVELLNLDERQQKVADQIIGSIDSDGYLRRDLDAIIDAVAFNDGELVTGAEAEQVLHQIQRLDPPGVAARSLQECLMIQLQVMETSHPSRKWAMEILEKAWPLFEKKHYDKIRRKLNLTETQLREANQVILLLDPKPGESDEYLNPDQFIVPDFEVYFEEALDGSDTEAGEFVIRLNNRNMPNIRISRHYKEMWDAMGGPRRRGGEPGNGGRGTRAGEVPGSGEQDRRDHPQKSGHPAAGTPRDAGGRETNGEYESRESKEAREAKEARQFIRDKMESARWFIDSIQQRRNTLMSVMRTIVALQEEFFRTGKGIRPMILKDVAERIQMDISTVSRVVNGKYVQTPFGVYELKYFFTEGLETDTGESVSNREIKNILLELVTKEEKSRPLSDQALAEALERKGYPVARRTISKYREQLNIPVARLRKDLG
ncbi:RNA polymerase sigma-54 factor [Balneolales bacterium ANBcel1]|nr:RNA polymerase sigma-54 factor [Balneolales bacterium ANBcel1]